FKVDVAVFPGAGAVFGNVAVCRRGVVQTRETSAQRLAGRLSGNKALGRGHGDLVSSVRRGAGHEDRGTSKGHHLRHTDHYKTSFETTWNDSRRLACEWAGNNPASFLFGACAITTTHKAVTAHVCEDGTTRVKTQTNRSTLALVRASWL